MQREGHLSPAAAGGACLGGGGRAACAASSARSVVSNRHNRQLQLYTIQAPARSGPESPTPQNNSASARHICMSVEVTCYTYFWMIFILFLFLSIFSLYLLGSERRARRLPRRWRSGAEKGCLALVRVMCVVCGVLL